MQDENNEPTKAYEFGEAECPECGGPVIGHFRDGVLMEVEPCLFGERVDEFH